MKKKYNFNRNFRGNFLFCLALGIFYFHSQAMALTDLPTNKTERLLEIEKVFVAPEGFDDNDNVQIVIDGNLPNICFELGKTSVTRDEDGKTLSIAQLTHKKNVLGCEQENMQDELNWKVPFQKELSLGQLPAGNYTIQFNLGSSKFQKRQFVVKKSTIRNVDDILYAPISSAFIPEMIYETENGEAVLTGILATTCLHLDQDKIKVQKFDDVIVVLPELSISKEAPCLRTPRPLHEIVSLGPLRKGRYLLHVRSMSGLSINKIFTVIKDLETDRNSF